MSENDRYTVWANEKVSRSFLEGVRSAIPLATEQLDVVLRVIRATQNRVDSFLDLGCGDGILGSTIYQDYPTAKGYFLDLSETMIEAAQEKLKDRDNARFILSDFGRADWVEWVNDDAPFDVIVSGFSIHHQPDARKQEIYREIYDLLKPGGLFLNLEHIASRSDWGRRAFDDLFIDALYAYHRSQGSEKSREEIDREYYNRGDKDANILAPLELQCDWLREIGFVEVDCFMKLFEMALFGGLRSHPQI